MRQRTNASITKVDGRRPLFFSFLMRRETLPSLKSPREMEWILSLGTLLLVLEASHSEFGRPAMLLRESRIVDSETIRLLLSEEHGVRTTSDAILQI